MRISPRVYVPVLAALVTATVIGGTFLWQIQVSVATIENGFRASGNPIQRTLAPLLARTISQTDNQTQSLTALKQGELFELQGRLKEAEDAYKRGVDGNGGIAALRKLAAIQLKRREFDAALASVDAWKRQGGDEKETTFMEGAIALHAGKTAQAKSTFDQIGSLPEGHYGLGLAAIVEGNNDEAKHQLTTAAKDGDGVLRTQATSLLSAYEEFALFPESPQTHLTTLISRALAQVNECEIALPLLAGVVSTQDRYRDAWTVKGFCEFSTERYKEALASLERAYALDPQKPEIQYFLARTHHALGDTQNAITFLQYAIVNGFPSQRDARQLLAQYAVESNNPAAALDALAAVTQQNDADLASFQSYIELALKTPGSENDGYQAAQRALKKWPDDPLALTLMAESALATNHIDQARQNIQSALSIDPGNQQARDLEQKMNVQIAAPQKK